jgi:hypothetical protein
MRVINLSPRLYNLVEEKKNFTVLVYDTREFHIEERVAICMVYSDSNGRCAAMFEAIIKEMDPLMEILTDLQVQRITLSKADMP